MKTITIKVPEELAIHLERRAKRLGAKSALVRESVEKAMLSSGAPEDEPSAYDLMKDGCGCVDSGVRDLSTNPKHMKGFGR